MLTVFSTPKGFDDPYIDTIQRNAIESWLRLPLDKEIILCGDDPGVAEVCREYNLRHLPEIAKNEYGTPLLNDIFTQAENTARYDTMCYINCDIILLSDFAAAVKTLLPLLNGRKFMASGRRWRVDITERVKPDFDLNGILAGLTPDAPSALDYFIYPKGLYADMPPFAIGRWWWDGYLATYARHKTRRYIDLSRSAAVLHQNHDYKHPGMENTTDRSELQAKGAEANVNEMLMKEHLAWPHTRMDWLDGADYIFKNGKLRRNKIPFAKRMLPLFETVVRAREKNRLNWYLLKIPAGILRRINSRNYFN